MTTEEYIDPSTLNPESVPYYGNMPDVQMAYPFSDETLARPDGNRGFVWPFRLAFGAEDDADRDKVPEWHQVDDLAGLMPLWAGVYGNKIFLRAEESKPAGAADEDDASGVIVTSSATADVWESGQPVLPYFPVPMEARDGMLKNAAGEWRRLSWEPMALFDIVPTKAMVTASGYYNIKRHTLYAIVEGSWIAFYTTAAHFDSGLYDDGAPARWPYSYCLGGNKGLAMDESTPYTPRMKDGGISVGWVGSLSDGYRLAPLPWQLDGSPMESVEAIMAGDGVAPGQHYALAPAFARPRYLATIADWRIDDAINTLARTGAYEYRLLGDDEAREAIVGTIQKTATEAYSIDPAVMEDLGRSFPNGVLEGTVWTDKPSQYHTIFSLHIPASAEQWPHWLACLSALSPTATLMASACRHYNDYNPTEPGPGTPNSPSTPGDGNTPPSEDDPGGVTPDNPSPNGPGGVDDPPEDDEETDTDKNTDPIELETGYYYEAGSGLQIQRVWNGKSWTHTVHIDDIAGSGTMEYKALITVSTKNSEGTYDWPDGNQYGLRMNYGVSASGSEIKVEWKSSRLGDGMAKQTTASCSTTATFTYKAEFSDFILTGEQPPSLTGNVISATRLGTFTKRGTYKSWDTFRQKWTTVRYVREFVRYRLSVQTGTLRAYCDAQAMNKAPNISGSLSPAAVEGKSSNIDGPTVKAGPIEEGEAAIAQKNQPESSTEAIYGDIKPTLLAEYEVAPAQATVSGNANWNNYKESGSISGTFTASFPATSTTIS